MSIILRVNKGQALTYDEHDRNLSQVYYSSSLDATGTKLRLHFTGSDSLDSGSEDYGASRYHEVSLSTAGVGEWDGTRNGNANITGSLTVSGSVVNFTNTDAISGSIFSGSFIGDGSGLTGISTSLPAGVVSSSAQVDHNSTANYNSAEHFTQANITTVGTVTTGDVSAILPSNLVSSSLQFNSFTSPFTGSFTGSFIGDGSGLTGIAGYARFDQVQNYTRAQYFTKISKGQQGGAVSIDLDTDQEIELELTGSATLSNPTNIRRGLKFMVNVKQDATGNRTLSYGTAYEFGENGTPTLSSGSNKMDILSFECSGNKLFFLGMQRGFDNYTLQ